MMDRAIGAISKTAGVNSFGMLYQWGRKDPFTLTNTLENSEVQIYNATGNPITKGTNGIGTADEQFKLDNTTITTINDLIQNPSTYYINGNGKGDYWQSIASTEYYNITKEGDWWNPTIKTLYDPCPNGYRIPKSGTYGEGGQVAIHSDWSVWSADGLKSGRVFKNSSFFPASGHRTRHSGGFRGVGESSNVWTSTAAKDNPVIGLCSTFSSTAVNPNYGGSPYSDSYVTRCIKD